MSSVRALANLFCSNCNEVTLHRSNVCTADNCNNLNKQSGNPPVPRPHQRSGNPLAKTRHHDHDAVRRARAARHHFPKGRP